MVSRQQKAHAVLFSLKKGYWLAFCEIIFAKLSLQRNQVEIIYIKYNLVAFYNNHTGRVKTRKKSNSDTDGANHLSKPYLVEKRCGFSRRAHNPKVVGSNPTSAKTLWYTVFPWYIFKESNK